MGACPCKKKNNKLQDLQSVDIRHGNEMQNFNNKFSNVPNQSDITLVKSKLMNNNAGEYGLTNYNQPFEYLEQLKQLSSFLQGGSSSKFRDEDFPAVMSSLIPDDENSIYLEGINKEKLNKLRSSVSWLEIEKFYNTKNVQLFAKNDRITPPEEITQGKLGNSYLIAAIAALLSSKPQMIREMFETTSLNSQGVVAIRLLLQGEPTLVLFDEQFPVRIGKAKKPAFSHCKGKEIWVAALEKAWTKINGKCYAKTYLGTPYEAFNSLVFAPTYFYYHKKYISRNRTDLVWNKLLDAKAKGYAICTNTEESSEPVEFSGENRDHSVMGQTNNQSNINLNVDQISAVGSNAQANFDNNQAFAVLDIYEFEELKLMKIWNPKGKNKDWNGEFAHNSENWSRELLDHVKYKKAPGIFFSTFEEFIKHFAWTYICKNENNFIYRSLKSRVYYNKNNQDGNFSSGKMEEEEVREEAKKEEFEPETGRKLITNDALKGKNKRVSNDEKSGLKEQENTQMSNPVSKPGLEEEKSRSQISKNSIGKMNDGSSDKFERKGTQVSKPGDLASQKAQSFEQSQSAPTLNDEREWIKKEDIFTCSFSIGDVPSRCYITLHQPLMRSLPETDLLCDLRPPLAFIVIAKLDENRSYSFVSSEMVNWEKLTIEQTLEKGEYHVFAKSYWNYAQPYNIVVSTYSDSISELNPLQFNQIPEDWLSQILSDMGRRSPNREYPCRDEPSSYASHLMFDNNNFSGFCLFYYENASRDGNMCINLNFKTLRGFKIMNLEHLLRLPGSEYTSDSGKFSDEDFGAANLVFKIPGGTSVVVIMQITDLPWLCSVDWYHDIWFEYPVEVMISKMRRSENTDKIELDRSGLYLYEMEHERGVIILLENLSNADYKINFDINTLKNLSISVPDEVIRTNNDRRLEFVTSSKGITILNFSIIKSPKEVPYKLRYVYSFALNKQ